MNREPSMHRAPATARAAEAPTDDQRPSGQTAGRHGRRRGAHRGQRPRWVMTAGGVAALTAVLGGGYAVAQSLADTTSGDPRTAADAAQQGGAKEGSLRKAHSAAPSAIPTPSKTAPPTTAHKKTAPKPSATATSPSPRTTTRPKSTDADGTHHSPGTDTTGRGAGGTSGRLARQVVQMVNAERAKAGCSPLTLNAKLQAAAQGHSDDMAARDYYDHTTPEGIGPGERMTSAGYRWSMYGENIFKGPKDARTAMDGWMKSPGHRDNILNCAFKEIGVGISLRSNGPWWTQNFGAASS